MNKHSLSQAMRPLFFVVLFSSTVLMAVWLALPANQTAFAELDSDGLAIGTLYHSRDIVTGDIDGDGWLDVVICNQGQPNELYLNSGGELSIEPDWDSADVMNCRAIVLGDWDGDGDLDLAVGNTNGEPNQVYANIGGTFSATAVWTSTHADDTVSVAWGDWNGDGYLDLATANFNTVNRIYENTGGDLNPAAVWDDGQIESSRAVAWADFDQDGDLDLSVANFGPRSRLYKNDNGVLTQVWQSQYPRPTADLAWGDVDGDGDLDLALVNQDTANARVNQLYRNDNGILSAAPVWESADYYDVAAVAWADHDGDQALDLVAAHVDGLVIYGNQGGSLTTTPIWEKVDPESNVQGIALADLDHDGDLDLLTANDSPAVPDDVYNQQFINTSQTISWTWSSGSFSHTRTLAWGDVNGDGYSDLLLGRFGAENLLYLNSSQGLAPTPVWSSTATLMTRHVAFGDFDGDGDIDLAVANSDSGSGQVVQLYRNDEGLLTSSAVWESPVYHNARHVAFGDVDGDGDLDLLVANFGEASVIYENLEGILDNSPLWTSGEIGSTQAAAFGDVDGDGDLDLLLGNYGQANTLYENLGGTLAVTPAWRSANRQLTHSVAWHDVDGDGDLDLAVGNDGQVDELYENHSGSLAIVPVWRSRGVVDKTRSISWGDWDGDGDGDLIVAGYDGASRVYQNIDGELEMRASWETSEEDSAYAAVLGDADGDGDLDLALANENRPSVVYLNPSQGGTGLPASGHFVAFGNDLAMADLHGTAVVITESIVPITFTLFGEATSIIDRVELVYSLDGGDSWQNGSLTTNTVSTRLTAGLFPTRTMTNTHVIYWDTFASGIFGQTDQAVVRLIAFNQAAKPSGGSIISYTHGLPAVNRRGFSSVTTYPFRLRGTQVQVFSGTQSSGHALAGATVYRLPAGQTQDAALLTNSNGRVWQTDSQGYLQGRGRLEVGDQLVATYPISTTGRYTVYHTSAAPTTAGLSMFEVSEAGVQTLVITGTNPLILFNLAVSLEWDSRNDPSFMAQLESNLHRASEVFYDLTNGQAALGAVHIYHDKGFWSFADLIIKASNNQRPSAILGGTVLTPTNDIAADGSTIDDAFIPGQIRMGPTWNRFGIPGDDLDEDWARTLAHEFGHYFLFLPDNYLGLTDSGYLTQVNCLGSAMTDPYVDLYSEFLTPAEWQGECDYTLAQNYLDRSDWETITKFYPMLNGDGGNAGPATLPLAVTRIDTFAPVTPTAVLAAPFFNLVDSSGGQIAVSTGKAEAYLIKTQNTLTVTDDYVIELGTPIGDDLQALGAEPGDRLCVFDYTLGALRSGCLESVGVTARPLPIEPISDWNPQIEVTLISTDTTLITVSNVTENNMQIQLLPAAGRASVELSMVTAGSGFTQTVTAPDGAYYGYVRIWVDGSDPQKELYVPFVATDNWGGRGYSWGGRGYSWGGNRLAWGGRGYSWGGRGYSWGGRGYSWGAPIMSGDGQVSIFPIDDLFGGQIDYDLQRVSQLPQVSSWLSVVGQSYRVSSAVNPTTTSAIIVSYLSRDVPSGQENHLSLYYSADEGGTWQRLETELDVYRNQASALVAGEGLYALMATLELPQIDPGWNVIGYPVVGSQPITQAFASIDGKYTLVYRYDTALDTWLIYDPSLEPPLASLVNTLDTISFGLGYWIYATETITPYVNPVVSSRQMTDSSLPPAVFYGWVADEFSPEEAMVLEAYIDGELCGETALVELDDGIGYSLVVASGVDECGRAGAVVEFVLDGTDMVSYVIWQNSRSERFDLLGSSDLLIYLPIVQR